MDYLWTPWRMAYLRKVGGNAEGDCVFCRKTETDDEAAEHVLYRSAHVYVTLNLFPYNNGHILIVPYTHTPSMETLPAEVLTDLMVTTNRALAVLRQAYNPQAFNIGANIGGAAGAGIVEHFHLHVVPRWNGDNNFMTIVAGTRVIPEWIDDTYRHLRELWARTCPGS